MLERRSEVGPGAPVPKAFETMRCCLAVTAALCPSNISSGIVPGDSGRDSTSGCAVFPGYSGSIVPTTQEPYYDASAVKGPFVRLTPRVQNARE